MMIEKLISNKTNEALMARKINELIEHTNNINKINSEIFDRINRITVAVEQISSVTVKHAATLSKLCDLL